MLRRLKFREIAERLPIERRLLDVERDGEADEHSEMGEYVDDNERGAMVLNL